MGDSKFTVHHTNSFSVSGDVLALEAHGLKPVGSSLSYGERENGGLQCKRQRKFVDEQIG